jgi:hypothetical protein
MLRHVQYGFNGILSSAIFSSLLLLNHTIRGIIMSNDILDVRDLIERYEELETQELKSESEENELSDLQALLDELEGNGGDEQWRGNWYPITLINESYFTEYSKELLNDCGDLPKDLPWYIESNIDWDGVAQDLKVDYSEVTYNEETYYYR